MNHYLITEGYYMQDGKRYSIPSSTNIMAKDIVTAKLLIEYTDVIFSEIIPSTLVARINTKKTISFSDDVFSMGSKYFELN